MLWGETHVWDRVGYIVKTKPKRSTKKEYKEKANQNLSIFNPIEAIGSLSQQEQTRRTMETREGCQKRQDYNVLVARTQQKVQEEQLIGGTRGSQAVNLSGKTQHETRMYWTRSQQEEENFVRQNMHQ